MKTKTRTILIALSVAAVAALNVTAGEALLSPRAMANHSRIAGFNNDPNLAATGLKSAPPRVIDNRIKTVPGKTTASSSGMNCSRKMNGSPKAIGACAEHAGAAMSCCSDAGTK